MAFTKPMQLRKADCNRIINDIAQAELKYFEQNNDFLYVYETDNDGILNINLQNYDGFDMFSCTVNRDNVDNKSVEIKVWLRSDDNQKKKFKDSFYSSYIYATQYQNGELSKMKFKLEKKITEQKN